MKYYSTMNYYCLFAISLSVFVSISASSFGICPRYAPMPDFSIKKFTGQWFEVERSFYLLEVVSSCTSLNLTINARGNLDVVASTMNRWTETYSMSSGKAIPMSKGSSIFRFKIDTSLPFSLARLLPGAGIYNILYTDFDNYAIMWSCTSYAFGHSDRFWIFGRTTRIGAKMRIHVYNKIRSLDLDTERLIISKNDNCDPMESF